MENVRGLLLDIAGTVIVDDRPLPGVRRALEAFAAADLPCLFVSNTTARTRALLSEFVSASGVKVPPERILTAPVAADQFLSEQGHTRCFFLLSEEILGDMQHCSREEEAPHAVVIGDLGEELDREALQRAFEFLLDDVPFYALARNRFFKRGGRLKLDVGPFVAALEYASGREATLLGKPSKRFFKAAASLLKLAPEEILVVGDDIDGDVGGALNAGMRGILVRTGKFDPRLAGQSKVTPTATVDSLADLPEFLGL